MSGKLITKTWPPPAALDMNSSKYLEKSAVKVGAGLLPPECFPAHRPHDGPAARDWNQRPAFSV
jgi:hypothetical protein